MDKLTPDEMKIIKKMLQDMLVDIYKGYVIDFKLTDDEIAVMRKLIGT